MYEMHLKNNINPQRLFFKRLHEFSLFVLVEYYYVYTFYVVHPTQTTLSFLLLFFPPSEWGLICVVVGNKIMKTPEWKGNKWKTWWMLCFYRFIDDLRHSNWLKLLFCFPPIVWLLHNFIHPISLPYTSLLIFNQSISNVCYSGS